MQLHKKRKYDEINIAVRGKVIKCILNTLFSDKWMTDLIYQYAIEYNYKFSHSIIRLHYVGDFTIFDNKIYLIETYDPIIHVYDITLSNFTNRININSSFCPTSIVVTDKYIIVLLVYYLTMRIIVLNKRTEQEQCRFNFHRGSLCHIYSTDDKLYALNSNLNGHLICLNKLEIIGPISCNRKKYKEIDPSYEEIFHENTLVETKLSSSFADGLDEKTILHDKKLYIQYMLGIDIYNSYES